MGSSLSYRREQGSPGAHAEILSTHTKLVVISKLSGMGSGQACGLRRNDRFVFGRER